MHASMISFAVAFVCSGAVARQAHDAGKLYPISSPPKEAGTFNVNTMRWMRPLGPAQQAGTLVHIYNNTCNWIGGAYYTGTSSCEDYFDEGEIPGPDHLPIGSPCNHAPYVVTADNNVTQFQFSYCTNFTVPQIKIGFYDSLGGECVGQSPPTDGPNHAEPPLPLRASGASVTTINPSGHAYYDLGALGLPGDSTPGGTGVSCWIVNVYLGNTGFCIPSEGEGVWDNVPDLDRFNWSWRMDNVQTAGAAPSGVVIAGEPSLVGGSAGTFGDCTYSCTCDIDPFTGGPCGTGLGTTDSFWTNIDGDIADGATNSGAQCIPASPLGTTCYWFGGYPGNPFANFWMVMIADGSCDGVVPTVNGNGCVGQVLPSKTQGCMSTVSWVGLPSASSLATFDVTFGGLNNNVSGVVFYGLTGRVNVPWSPHSNLCVKAPIQRLSSVMSAAGNTGGSPPCAGQFTFDFNRIIQGTYPALLGTPMSIGQSVDSQAWTRDPANIKTTILSQKLHFIVGT